MKTSAVLVLWVLLVSFVQQVWAYETDMFLYEGSHETHAYSILFEHEAYIEDGHLTLYYNPVSEPEWVRKSGIDVGALIARAGDSWEETHRSIAAVSFMGKTDLPCGYQYDGISVVCWKSLPQSFGKALVWADNDHFIRDASISLSLELLEYADAEFIVAVLRHEIGHALGLGHSTEGYSVMSSRFSKEYYPRSLQRDDEMAIRSVYPYPRSCAVSTVIRDSRLMIDMPPVKYKDVVYGVTFAPSASFGVLDIVQKEPYALPYPEGECLLRFHNDRLEIPYVWWRGALYALTVELRYGRLRFRYEVAKE